MTVNLGDALTETRQDLVKAQAGAKKALDEVEGLSKRAKETGVTAVVSGAMVRGLAALGKFFRGG